MHVTSNAIRTTVKSYLLFTDGEREIVFAPDDTSTAGKTAATSYCVEKRGTHTHQLMMNAKAETHIADSRVLTHEMIECFGTDF